MRIALACAPVKNKNLLFNLNQMKKAVEACRGKAELILFGESVLQGFDSLCWDYKTDCEVAVSLTGEPIRQMCSVARENQIAISFGFIQKTEDALYSSQILIGAEGRLSIFFIGSALVGRNIPRVTNIIGRAAALGRFPIWGNSLQWGCAATFGQMVVRKR